MGALNTTKMVNGIILNQIFCTALNFSYLYIQSRKCGISDKL